MREGFPLSNRLIREIHGVLLSRGRGSDKDPGEFRRIAELDRRHAPRQRLVRAAAAHRRARVHDRARALHAQSDDGIPTLLRAALAHVQFETIHPFLDGNGRVGRLLITFLLCHAGVLREPLLYLSLYFKQHRSTYYELLDRVRRDGDWEAWIDFFLRGVQQVAEGAVSTAERLGELFRDRSREVEDAGRRAGSALRLHEAFKARPIQSMTALSEATGYRFRRCRRR